MLPEHAVLEAEILQSASQILCRVPALTCWPLRQLCTGPWPGAAQSSRLPLQHHTLVKLTVYFLRVMMRIRTTRISSCREVTRSLRKVHMQVNLFHPKHFGHWQL
jgi:hypothetical protein